MSFRIEKNEPVDAGLERVLREQIDKALGELDDDSLDRAEAIHQVRKRCKKARAIFRLLRGAIDDDCYKRENVSFRDMARSLSDFRDSGAVLETLERLEKTFALQTETELFERVRKALIAHDEAGSVDEDAAEAALARFRVDLEAARDRLDDWASDEEGFDAVEGGLHRTYQRGRKAMSKAVDEPTTENLHEWRKRVKYHWYETRLLRNVWQPVMKGYRKEFAELSDLLGDDHDLAVLVDSVRSVSEDAFEEKDREALFGLIDRERRRLQQQAFGLGRRAYFEKPDALVARLEAWWKVWRSSPADDGPGAQARIKCGPS